MILGYFRNECKPLKLDDALVSRESGNNRRRLASRLLAFDQRELELLCLPGGNKLKTKIKSVWTLGTLAVLLTFGVSLSAQQGTPPTAPTDPASAPQSQPTQPTDPTAQQPATRPQTDQTPDQGGQAAPDARGTSAASGDATQSFSGTIVKSGDKYLLQDADSGKSYDIDHQEQVKQYEGKKVRVHGTLDANNKIHLQ